MPNSPISFSATRNSESGSPPPLLDNNNRINGEHEYSGEELQQHLLETQERLPITRPSRIRHLKNPPQPHMCIKDRSRDGQELYINVMSWTKIVMPQNSDDPIPLYGGMRVPPGMTRSPSPSHVYAVMANPEILKHVGRNCPDPEEKLALVELMSDFVEAMNPGLKLAREAEVLKDRDLAGELKDIWGAVQAKRERDKEDSVSSSAAPSYDNYMASNKQVIYVEFGPETAYQAQEQNQQLSEPIQQIQQSNLITTPSAITTNNEQTNGVVNNSSPLSSPSICSITTKTVDTVDHPTKDAVDAATEIAEVISSKCNKITDVVVQKTTSLTQLSTVSSPVTTPQSTPPPTKKEKLGGFLPNSCHSIFPFIKSKNQHKKEHKEKKLKQSKSNGGSATATSGGGVGGTNGMNGESHSVDSTADALEITATLQQKANRDVFNNDACVDKMQKLKL